MFDSDNKIDTEPLNKDYNYVAGEGKITQIEK